jgi:hypothetical protein
MDYVIKKIAENPNSVTLHITAEFPTIQNDLVNEAPFYLDGGTLLEHQKNNQSILCQFNVPTDNYGDRLMATKGEIKISATLHPNMEDPKFLFSIPFDPQHFVTAIKETRGKRKLEDIEEVDNNYKIQDYPEMGCKAEYYFNVENENKRVLHKKDMSKELQKRENIHTVNLIILNPDAFYNSIINAEPNPRSAIFSSGFVDQEPRFYHQSVHSEDSPMDNWTADDDDSDDSVEDLVIDRFPDLEQN